MSTTRSIGRLSEIAQVMVRHGFGYFLEAHKLSDLLPGRSAEDRLAGAAAEQGASSARGQHLREVLDELGPTFVKFGQLLSTRPDVVPPDIIVELRGLQDDVRPFPFEQAERVIEEELGNTLERLFLDFDPTPVAAASIGQVH
ncbi:MAG: AarF/UbiB family protein, partial [Gaiellaceae bacterium]